MIASELADGLQREIKNVFSICCKHDIVIVIHSSYLGHMIEMLGGKMVRNGIGESGEGKGEIVSDLWLGS